MLGPFPHTSSPTRMRGGACRDTRPQEPGDHTAVSVTRPRDPNIKKPQSGQGEAAARVGTESLPLVLAQRPDVGMRKSWP